MLCFLELLLSLNFTQPFMVSYYNSLAECRQQDELNYLSRVCTDIRSDNWRDKFKHLHIFNKQINGNTRTSAKNLKCFYSTPYISLPNTLYMYSNAISCLNNINTVPLVMYYTHSISEIIITHHFINRTLWLCTHCK